MTSPASPLQFELITVGGAETATRYFPPDSATYQALFKTGVPRDFLEGTITTDPVVSVFEAPGIGPVLRFAQFGRHYLAVDPATERVLWIIEPHHAKLRKLDFANSSLPQFVETTRLLTERFPYEYWDEEYQTDAYAEHDLARLIASVDPLAYAPNVDGHEPFWHIFVADVSMGSCSQEVILGIEWQPEPATNE